jgi:molecular chaperone GrpE
LESPETHARAQPDAPAVDASELAAEVERLRQALAEAQYQSRRLLADFENYRRRVASEQTAARREGTRAALLPLLPVLDTLERALAAGSTDRRFYDGVAAIQRLFVSALREAGVEPVESVGRPFDPRLHEAVATVPSDGVEPGAVAREVQRGWRLGDELIRPARVVVAASREEADPWR